MDSRDLEPAPEGDTTVRGDLWLLARGGTLNLLGGVVYGLIGFAVVVVVTRRLTPSGTGLFFEGVALFNLATEFLVLGADIGLVRFISARRALGTGPSPKALLAVALAPLAALSGTVAIVGSVLAPTLARLVGKGPFDAEQVTWSLRVFMVAVPIAVVYTAAIAATRGFGTMVPAVLIDRMGRPILQLLLVVGVVTADLGAMALALAWTVPAIIGAAAAAWSLVRLVPTLGTPRGGDVAGTVPLSRRFWRFAAPRGLAGIFQVTILWLDTLLLGALRSSREAGIYTASSRFILLGAFVLPAVNQAIAPQLGAFLAARETKRAEIVFQTAAAWMVAATWPIYLTMAVFAPVILRTFGRSFENGARVVVILSLAELVATATGSVDWALLMSGHSGWNLLNTSVALAANVGLNLLLIPRYGMVGAAAAWATSIVLNNVMPMIELWLLVHISPFGRGVPLAAAASASCFGALGLLSRLLFGPSVRTLVVYVAVASLIYAIALVRLRGALDLPSLLAALKRRGARTRRDAPAAGSSAGAT